MITTYCNIGAGWPHYRNELVVKTKPIKVSLRKKHNFRLLTAAVAFTPDDVVYCSFGVFVSPWPLLHSNENEGCQHMKFCVQRDILAPAHFWLLCRYSRYIFSLLFSSSFRH